MKIPLTLNVKFSSKFSQRKAFREVVHVCVQLVRTQRRVSHWWISATCSTAPLTDSDTLLWMCSSTTSFSHRVLQTRPAGELSTSRLIGRRFKCHDPAQIVSRPNYLYSSFPTNSIKTRTGKLRKKSCVIVIFWPDDCMSSILQPVSNCCINDSN